MTDVVCTPMTIAQGGSTTVAGHGYNNDAPVEIYLDGKLEVSTMTGQYGNFIDNHAKVIIIPTNATVGNHVISATDGTHTGTATISVTGTISPPLPTNKILFQDTFASLDKWVVMDGVHLNGIIQRASNVFIDSGGLVLRTKREAGTYSGGFVATFAYGTGWPPKDIKASLPVPFRIDVEALMPATPGAWCGPWLMNVNKTSSQLNYELDMAEERMTIPTVAGCHQHAWESGSDKHPWDGHLNNVSNMGKNWHTYTAKVHSDHVDYLIDNTLIGTAYGVDGLFGILMDNGIAVNNPWASDGKLPDPNDPGPWDMRVRSIIVTAL